jgi:hypothetical protein
MFSYVTAAKRLYDQKQLIVNTGCIRTEKKVTSWLIRNANAISTYARITPVAAARKGVVVPWNAMRSKRNSGFKKRNAMKRMATPSLLRTQERRDIADLSKPAFYVRPACLLSRWIRR